MKTPWKPWKPPQPAQPWKREGWVVSDLPDLFWLVLLSGPAMVAGVLEWLA